MKKTDIEIAEGKNKVTGYDNVRIIATILVVIGHCTTISIGKGEMYSSVDTLIMDDVCEYIRQFIYGFHMPLFVALSGSVFFLSFKNTNKKKWIIKRAKRLLIPYFVVAVLLLIPVRLLTGYYEKQYNIFEIILSDVIISWDINYLWYLYMLFQVSLIFVLFYDCFVTGSTKRKLFLFTILLIVSNVQYAIGVLPFQIHRAMEFLVWFYFGILFEQRRSDILLFLKKPLITTLLLSLYIIAFLLSTQLSVFQELYGVNSVVIKALKMLLRNVMSFSGVIFVISICFNIHKIDSKFLEWVSKRSMQIYLYHVPCIFLYSWVISCCISYDIINNLLYVFLIVFKIFVAFAASYIIDKTVIIIKKLLRKEGSYQ